MIETNNTDPSRLLSRLTKIASAGALTLALAACTVVDNQSTINSRESQSNGAVDLIGNSQWKQSNVYHDNNMLIVKESGQSITNQDGTPGQQNPPVNLFGTHLERRGDFSVSFAAEDLEGTALINLYGAPPIIEDEFRAEVGTLSIRLENDNVHIALSDQADGLDTSVQNFQLTSSSTHTFKMTSVNNTLTFTLDGKLQPETLSANGLFGQSIWLGLDSQNGSFGLRSLGAEGENNGIIKAKPNESLVTQQNNGLASLITSKRADMLFGAAVAAGPIVGDSRYRELLGNFNAITVENAGKWQFIHPKPELYNFSDMDGLVESAQAAGQKIHGHALIFGEANPQWLQDLSSDPQKLEAAGIAHIKTVVHHYKDKVSSWDVINEPLANYDTVAGSNGLRKNLWYNALGPGYIETMLQAAHDADPNAELWINDFGMESDDTRFNQMLSLVTKLKSERIPLTGVGFQAHVDDRDTIENNTHMDEAKLRSRISDLQALGLKTRFSEVDITEQSQHAVTADIISACLAERACRGVTTWGITDKYSSGGTIDERGRFQPGSGLLWDAQLAPTQGVKDIFNALK